MSVLAKLNVWPIPNMASYRVVTVRVIVASIDNRRAFFLPDGPDNSVENMDHKILR